MSEAARGVVEERETGDAANWLSIGRLANGVLRDLQQRRAERGLPPFKEPEAPDAI